MTKVPVLLFCLLSCLAAAAASRPPNILFVLADQWRAQAFGYAGDPNVRTPTFDRLAGSSINFRDAVSGVPVCSPTRASILTGQWPTTHGVFLNDVPLKTNAVTLSKVLKAAGYNTGYIGKWHLDGHGRSEYIPPERRQGFDYWKVLECTHNYNQSHYYGDGPEKLTWEGYDAVAQTRDAQGYLESQAQTGKPFLLFLAWGPPHAPYHTAPARYRQLYDPASLILRPNVPEGMEERVRKDLAGYYAHCTALDDCMEQLWTTLRTTGLETNTLIVFTSEHGDLLGSHSAYKKQQPYEESVRVPLLFYWPAGLGVEGRRSSAAFSSMDFMPTLLGLCDLTIPDSVQGIDFSGHLRGGPDPSKGAALIGCPAPFGQWARRLGGREYRGVRSARHTYTRDLSGPWLLFDNVADPFQMTNLVNRAETADTQRVLEGMLQAQLERVGDQLQPAGELIKKWGYTVDATGTVPYKP